MKYLFFITLFSILVSCSNTKEAERPVPPTKKKKQISDSTTVKQFSPLVEDCFDKGELVVLLNNSVFSYMLYRGVPKGYEYELLQMFCDDHNIKLKVKVVPDAAHILDSLNAGLGHMAAANFTINTSRKAENDFSAPFFKTKQILIQHLPNNWRKMTVDNIKKSLIQDPLDLDGKTVMVKSNSAFYNRLTNFAYENGLDINVIQSTPLQTTEDLIELVNKREIDYTVADQNTIKFYEALYSGLDFGTPISFNQNIAWAINKSQTKLLNKVNAWIKNKKGGLEFNMLQDRYFHVTKKSKRLIQEGIAAVYSGQISPYDELLKENAKEENLDWVLLTSLIFQESKFNPKAKSWAGAMGLSQMMPATAGDMGISNPRQLYIPKVSIRVGAEYFKQLVDFWRPILKDSVQANYFALASYNTGKGHVLDARRIATRTGKDKDKWFGNVESALLLKSNPAHFNEPHVKYGYSMGKEPVQYVKNILTFYERFNQYLKEKIK